MRKYTNPGTSEPPLAPVEFDFSNVPDSELESCLFYEYMRESEAIIREIRSARKQMPDSAKRPGASFDSVIGVKINARIVTYLGHVFEHIMFLILAQNGQFPRVPWQALPDADRKALLNFPRKARRSHRSHAFREDPPLKMDSINENPLLGRRTLKQWIAAISPEHHRKVPASELKKYILSGFFQINMGYSQAVLFRRFRDMLKQVHPEPVKIQERRGRRNTGRDALNALGALRLRFFCRSLTQAQKLIASLGLKARVMHYSDRTAFNRGCDSAIKHFNRILKLPAGNLPIHFSKGWRK